MIFVASHWSPVAKPKLLCVTRPFCKDGRNCLQTGKEALVYVVSMCNVIATVCKKSKLISPRVAIILKFLTNLYMATLKMQQYLNQKFRRKSGNTVVEVPKRGAQNSGMCPKEDYTFQLDYWIFCTASTTMQPYML